MKRDKITDMRGKLFGKWTWDDFYELAGDSDILVLDDDLKERLYELMSEPVNYDEEDDSVKGAYRIEWR